MADTPDVHYERGHWDAGRVVVGVDEVGRGALAGPLTIAAVAFVDAGSVPDGLRDSKQLTAAARERLHDDIYAATNNVAVAHVPPDVIDADGMAAALRAGSLEAVNALPQPPDVVLLDGTVNFLAGHHPEVTVIPKGDALSVSIAAASIVAKVTRDRMMAALDPEHPAYGFASNKGYLSAEHQDALTTYGPCSHHRASWGPVAQPRLF